MKKAIATTLTVALALGLSACGEYPQVVEYKAGKYQGKKDTRPWEGGEFAGNKQAWDTALANRAQAQNEYKRAQ
jgi:starvation-inducible outer membrane lipoprotein